MLGIIGGTGLYNIEGLEITQEEKIDTPFGAPSAPLSKGHLGSQDVVFLPRHGKHHEHLPSEINYRANIWALKSLGVRRIISVSAVGSLEQSIAPGHLALPSQYLDLTKGKRAHTFFGDGVVAHISTAQPVCTALTTQLSTLARKLPLTLHTDKTYACVEGPRLGTRAESFFLKNNGCHLVGMTNIPEAFLAREAQLCYCTIAVATDYDCWLEDPEEHVTIDKLLARYKDTLVKVRNLLGLFLEQPAAKHIHCPCRKSLKDAVLTAEPSLSRSKQELLQFLRL